MDNLADQYWLACTLCQLLVLKIVLPVFCGLFWYFLAPSPLLSLVYNYCQVSWQRQNFLVMQRLDGTLKSFRFVIVTPVTFTLCACTSIIYMSGPDKHWITSVQLILLIVLTLPYHYSAVGMGKTGIPVTFPSISWFPDMKQTEKVQE